MSDHTIESSDEGALSFAPFVRAIWVERRRIVMSWAISALVFVLGALTYYLLSASERTARVEFRLEFSGAERGEYPNGTPFARADVIAAPILTQVYQKNELERYIPFERFKSGLFIFESSREIDLLNYEYQARLSDSKLPHVERAKIEAEFRQKLDAQRVPQMSLQFMVSSRTDVPPSHVMEKVLNDILAEWAEQAAAQRGALGHQIELMTPNVILKDTLNTQTILIRYDMLRRHVARVLAQVDRLMKLPGANTTRVGKERLSLIDLRTNLEDLLEFQLNPLMKRRLIYALPANEVALNILYLDDRLVELQRFRTTAEQRKAQLEGALRNFTAEAVASSSPGARPADGTQVGAAPQLSDSFLDRLMDIAGRSSAMDYRTGLTDRIILAGEESLSVDQDVAFYQETLRLLRAAAAGSRIAVLKPEDVLAAFDTLQKRVVEILELTNEAYTTISATNLNPRSVLYRLTGPYSVQTLRSVQLPYLAMIGIVFLVVAGIAIALVLAAIGLFKQSAFAQARSRPV
jgi:hypothetical protein